MVHSVCVFGDSVSRGVVLDEAKQRYIDCRESFARRVALRAHLTVGNFSRFGCTVTKGGMVARRHLADAAAADWTVVEFGGNDCDYHWAQVAAAPQDAHDCNTPPQRFAEEYRALLATVQQAGGRPVVFSLPPVDGERYLGWISRALPREPLLQFLGSAQRIHDWQAHYSALAVDAAHSQGVPVIDLRGAFLTQKNWQALLCGDGIHPNADGHRLIGEVLESYLARA